MTPNEKTFVLHYIDSIEFHLKGLRAMLLRASYEESKVTAAQNSSKLQPKEIDYLSEDEERAHEERIALMFGTPVKEEK